MEKEKFKKQFMGGKNAEIDLPVSYWMFLVALLDRLCEDSLQKIEKMNDAGEAFDSKSKKGLSAPFLTRALILDDLCDKGVLTGEQVDGKDLVWVQEVLQSMQEGPFVR